MYRHVQCTCACRHVHIMYVCTLHLCTSVSRRCPLHRMFGVVRVSLCSVVFSFQRVSIRRVHSSGYSNYRILAKLDSTLQPYSKLHNISGHTIHMYIHICLLYNLCRVLICRKKITKHVILMGPWCVGHVTVLGMKYM